MVEIAVLEAGPLRPLLLGRHLIVELVYELVKDPDGHLMFYVSPAEWAVCYALAVFLPLVEAVLTKGVATIDCGGLHKDFTANRALELGKFPEIFPDFLKLLYDLIFLPGNLSFEILVTFSLRRQLQLKLQLLRGQFLSQLIFPF